MLTISEHSPITPQVLDTMVELEASVVLPRKDEAILLKQTRERLSAEAEHSGAWALVGHLDGKPFGFVFGFAATYEPECQDTTRSESIEYLSSLCVRPDMQGHGYGAELLRRAEQYATKLGRDSITLFTAEKNDGARRLYEREGWQEERITERQLGETSYNIIHYSKKLA